MRPSPKASILTVLVGQMPRIGAGGAGSSRVGAANSDAAAPDHLSPARIQRGRPIESLPPRRRRRAEARLCPAVVLRRQSGRLATAWSSILHAVMCSIHHATGWYIQWLRRCAHASGPIQYAVGINKRAYFSPQEEIHMTCCHHRRVTIKCRTCPVVFSVGVLTFRPTSQLMVKIACNSCSKEPADPAGHIVQIDTRTFSLEAR